MWKDALARQHQRCEVYTQWDYVFKQVLGGTLTAEDFTSLLTQTIVVKFQEISAAVRAIRDAAPTNPETPARAAVRKWAADLQLHEKAKYDTTVELQSLVIEHLSRRGEPLGVGEEDDQVCGHHCRDCPLAALLLHPAPERSVRCFRLLFNLEPMDEHTEDDNGSGALAEDSDEDGGSGGTVSRSEADRVTSVRRCQQFNARHALLRRKLQQLQGDIAALMHEAQECISDESS